MENLAKVKSKYRGMHRHPNKEDWLIEHTTFLAMNVSSAIGVSTIKVLIEA